MDPLTTNLRPPPPRQDDHLAAIRRNNKRLIIAFFILILAVAAVTGGIIVSLIHQLNHQSKSLIPNAGIRGLCTVVDDESSCASFLSHTIQAPPDSTPTDILRLSLQAALAEVSNLLPLLPPSDSDSLPNPLFRSTVRDCAASLRGSETGINNATRMMWPDPDEETRAAVSEAVETARGGLGGCWLAVETFLLEATDAESAKLYGPRAAVDRANKLLYYGVLFLSNFDAVNKNYYAQINGAVNENYDAQIDGVFGSVVDGLGAVTLYGIYYVVLVFLFCLLLRIY